MKRAIKVILGLCLLGVAALLLMPSKGAESLSEQFRFDKVSRGDISQTVTANGTLNPTEIASVGTQVSGTVEKLYVDVNDEVTKGQLLAELDPQLLKSALKQQKSSLEITRLNYHQAGRDLKRAKELYAMDYIARVEVERAEQAYMSAKLSLESAEAQVERAEVELGYSKVTSPINGVVISKEVTEGQTVAASFQAPTLFRIAGSLEDMKIDVIIPESDIGMVKKGMPVTFTVDAYIDKTFEGVLDTINLNPNSGQLVVTYTATVVLRNDERLLLPGMTAYVDINVEQRENVLRVPAAALRFQPPAQKESSLKNLFNPTSNFRRWRGNESSNATPGVYVLRAGDLQRVEIVPGMTDEDYVEIISGDIKEGESVAVGFARRAE